MKKCYLLLLCSCVTSTAAHADLSETFSPFVATNFNYNSNLFALQNDQTALSVLGSTQTSDYISTFMAGVNMNWKLSQQTLTGHAIVNQSWFNTYKTLDNNGSDLALQWNWVVDDSLLGTIGATETTQLGNLTYIQQPLSDIFTIKTAFFTGGVKLDDRWQLNFGANSTRYTNSATSMQPYNLTLSSVNAGIQYMTTKGSKVEWNSQLTNGVYPGIQYNGIVPATDKFTQTDNGITLNWISSGKTQLSGGINYTQHISPDNPAQSYAGMTGRIDANWAITGKTSLDLALYRNIMPYDTATTGYEFVQGGTLIFTWLATAKITANLRLLNDSVDFPVDSGFAATGAAPMHIRMDIASIGVNYLILRNTKLALNAERGVRAANTAGFSYTYNSVTLGLQQSF